MANFGEEKERGVADFSARFGTDEACYAYLAEWHERRKGGLSCPSAGCGGGLKWRETERPSRRTCIKCRKHVSLLAGTVMEGSRIPVRKWFLGAYLVAECGATAKELQRRLPLGSYQSAWKMHDTFRRILFGPAENFHEGLGQRTWIASVELDSTHRSGGGVRLVGLFQVELPVQGSGDLHLHHRLGLVRMAKDGVLSRFIQHNLPPSTAVHRFLWPELRLSEPEDFLGGIPPEANSTLEWADNNGLRARINKILSEARELIHLAPARVPPDQPYSNAFSYRWALTVAHGQEISSGELGDGLWRNLLLGPHSRPKFEKPEVDNKKREFKLISPDAAVPEAKPIPRGWPDWLRQRSSMRRPAEVGMKSRRLGHCLSCGGLIEVGARIFWWPRHGARHVGCPPYEVKTSKGAKWDEESFFGLCGVMGGDGEQARRLYNFAREHPDLLIMFGTGTQIPTFRIYSCRGELLVWAYANGKAGAYGIAEYERQDGIREFVTKPDLDLLWEITGKKLSWGKFDLSEENVNKIITILRRRYPDRP